MPTQSSSFEELFFFVYAENTQSAADSRLRRFA